MEEITGRERVGGMKPEEGDARFFDMLYELVLFAAGLWTRVAHIWLLPLEKSWWDEMLRWDEQISKTLLCVS